MNYSYLIPCRPNYNHSHLKIWLTVFYLTIRFPGTPMVSTIGTVVTTDTSVSQMVSTTDTGTTNFVSPVYSETPTTTSAPDPSTPVTQHHFTSTEGTKDISTDYSSVTVSVTRDSTRMETTQNLDMKSAIPTQLNYGHSVTESAPYTTSEISKLESSSAAPGNHNTESILSTTLGEDTKEGGSTKNALLTGDPNDSRANDNITESRLATLSTTLGEDTQAGASTRIGLVTGDPNGSGANGNITKSTWATLVDDNRDRGSTTKSILMGDHHGSTVTSATSLGDGSQGRETPGNTQLIGLLLDT